MKNEDFQKLVKNDKHQVFIFTCPCSIPVSFAPHFWFVLNKKGELSRWEVKHLNWEHKTRWGHLYRDIMPPTKGLELFPSVQIWYWGSKIIGSIEGDENSIAKQMVDFIENSKNTYAYNYIYSFIGPNSNTYIQWILNHFPEFGVKLPWNAFGKGYKK